MRAIGLVPSLTASEKDSLKTWLLAVLATPTLVDSSGRTRFPLSGRIAVYSDGHPRILMEGTNWQDSVDSFLYIGRSSGGGNSLPVIHRLAVLAAVISVTELWDEVEEVFTATVSRVMLESYNMLLGGLVESRAPATGMAFNEANNNQIAVKIGDCWHLQDGTAVEVGDGWTVVG